MKKLKLLTYILVCITFISCKMQTKETNEQLKPFTPPISYEEAGKRADSLLAKMSIDEKIQLIGGFNLFFVKGFEKYKIPQFYLSDATQGVHIRKELSSLMEKSTAFPCPLALTATWNPQLANKYATCIGEECRASDVAVLLGPGMNIYRISQNGRNFEYFGEDPFLAARMVENYVVGMQSTGTITTLKHFLCNNTDYHRRTSNSVVDERTLHEIYLPAFQAGVNAGAMAVMTSYNQLNGEWTGQSKYVISELLKGEMGFKWLVMTDWWSVYDAEKVIKSGQDLEMPGHAIAEVPELKTIGDIYVRSNAKKLLNEGKVSEADINIMAKNIMRTFIAMGMYDRPVKDTTLLKKLPEHAELALQTAREAIVLLRNEDNILPINKETKKKILVTGGYVEKIARGGGSAEVEGYDNVTMLSALKNEFGNSIEYIQAPDNEVIKSADLVLVSVGTDDSEGWDRPFNLPDSTDKRIAEIAQLNPNTVVIVSSGSGIQMTGWNDKVKGIVYAWYSGQKGNIALAEILSGKTNPSGRLPISIEKKFEDSPGASYIPKGESLYANWHNDLDFKRPVHNVEYKEGVFVGYRWYESKNIEPLYHFGFGLSYTTFEYSNIKVSSAELSKNGELTVSFTVTNTGKVAGADVAQIYVQDVKASVPRPVKELKGFKKVFLNPGESKEVSINLTEKDFAYWDVNKKDWYAEPGDFNILLGASSNNIKQTAKITIK